MSDPRIIDSKTKPGSLVGEWVVAVALTGLALVVSGLAFAGDLFSGGAGPKLIAGVFLFVGICMVIKVAFQTQDAFRFGRIRLHLRVTPVTIGSALEGELEFPKKAASLSNVVGTLACIRITWHSSSGSAVRSDQDIWAASKALELVVRGVQGKAALRFDIPANQPHSDARSSSGWTPATAETVEHEWELRVKAAAPGLNLERRFPLTVRAGA